jgi:hypothetical protein
MDDSTATAGNDGRWMTYAELADLRGISRKAAARLTLRHGWRRQPGNDGTTRVHVPDAMARRQTPRADRPLSGLSNPRADALADANRRADEANARADAALALAEQTMVQLADAGARADRFERDLSAALEAADAARGQARVAEDRAGELARAEETRRAKGRLRRAWDGWRGR